MTHEKISPRLLFALNSFRAHGESVLLKRIRTVGIVPALGRPKATRTVIFIHCHENADLGDLAALGVELNQPRGKVRTAILPLDAVEKVADHPAVQRVMASHTLRPLMDVALPALHVPAFRQSNSLSGKNVVIGTVDTGIDSNHPAFAGRILRIWDQTLSGPGVAEGGYGAELTGSLLSVSEDDEGHGTHVAGIAASGDAKYTGVAPDAVLVAVKTDFNTAHIADGVRYIFRIAKEMNLPAVVNLSLGGHSDAHDGTDSLSQLIDSESGPGRIVCCAAGNEGNDNIHAKRNLKPGQSLTMRFVVGSAQVDEVFLNGWYSGGAALEVSIRTPGGFTIPYQPVITSGSPARQYSLPDALLNIATPGPDPDNSDHNVLVSLDGPGRGFVRNGIWQLRLKNTSNKATDVHFWSMDDHEPTATVFTGRSIDDSTKVGSPGSAARAITVASFTTRTSWTDIDGNVETVAFQNNDISDFSSEGPLRDGSSKPDVAAPGAIIVSSLSSRSSPERAWMIDNSFRGMAGTSMATPFVAGLTALLLERNPALDPAGVKTLLNANSAVPGKPAGAFDPKWGFGLIDAANL